MIQKSDQINELSKALASFQAELFPAIKDGKNPHFNSKYVTLTNVWEACKHLSKFGLSVIQSTVPNKDGVELVTNLLHTSGQFWSSSLFLPVVQKTPQAFGSALTYARRYGLTSMVGVTQEDDDGNEGSRASQIQDHQVLSKPTTVIMKPGVKKGSGAFCEACETELILSKKGSYYCPNFKDGEKTGQNHTNFVESKLESFKDYQRSTQSVPQSEEEYVGSLDE